VAVPLQPAWRERNNFIPVRRITLKKFGPVALQLNQVDDSLKFEHATVIGGSRCGGELRHDKPSELFGRDYVLNLLSSLEHKAARHHMSGSQRLIERQVRQRVVQEKAAFAQVVIIPIVHGTSGTDQFFIASSPASGVGA
jgi:hypothetical protein